MYVGYLMKIWTISYQKPWRPEGTGMKYLKSQKKKKKKTINQEFYIEQNYPTKWRN